MLSANCLSLRRLFGPSGGRLLVVGICLITAMAWVSAPAVHAQEDEAAPAEPDPVPVEQDVVGKNTEVEDISYLKWALDSMGWFFGLVFVGLSFTLVALFVMNLLTARRENVIPTDLVTGFEQHLDAKQFQEAYDLARVDESFLGQVLTAGLAKASSGGYSQAIEAMQEVGEEENMRLEHQLSYLALIGTLSPMIGLLGTVYGMIDSFKLIANTATGTPDPQALAQGISTALFTTLVGLALAIPALAAYNLLRNRVARLVLEVGITSEGLMSRFQKKS
jgi:biopolymer transport protein ExbB